jgi:hypothetical protein
MNRKFIVMALTAAGVAGCLVFFVLDAKRNAARSGRKTSISELARRAEYVVRDLAGGNRSELSKTSGQILELVPFGTSLEAARQIIMQHQFSCSIDSYTNPAQMSNSAIWYAPFVKNGQRLAVTNVSRLKCTTNTCVATFWVVNGETTSLAVKGDF